MPLITRDAKASVDASTASVAPQLSGGLIAAEDLDPLAPCRVGADGRVYMSNGAAADANAHVDGFTPRDYRAGEPVTLYGPGLRARYGAGLTPGTDLHLGAIAGRLDDAATLGGPDPIARVISASEIVVMAKQ